MKHQTIRPIDRLVADLLSLQPEITLTGDGTSVFPAERLSDDHPLKKQAILVLDALESVTNGMENPDALEGLNSLPQNSFFSSWASLIQAIKAFYEDDPSRVRHELSAIPPGSPPFRLVPLLLSLAGHRQDEFPPGGIERKIVDGIRNPDGLLADFFKLTREPLSGGQEEIFSDTLGLLVKELFITSPGFARRAALWAFHKLYSVDKKGGILEDNLSLIFGSLETTRLKALSLMDAFPKEAVRCWVDYTRLLLEGAPRPVEEIEAAFSIGAFLCETAEPFEEYGLFLEGMIEDFHFLLHNRYPILSSRSAGCNTVGEIFHCIGSSNSLRKRPKKPISGFSNRFSGQLELLF